MATTLGEFHTLVSDALGRGTSLDSVIPKRVEMAARWIERSLTFQYMRTWRTFSVDPDADYPHIVSLFNMELKKIELIRKRSTNDEGEIVYGRPLTKAKPEDRESRPEGTPESYWLNGVNSITFNAVPDEAMDFEAHLVQFTKWGSGSIWTHWLLDHATGLLLARTCQLMTIRTRDPGLWKMYDDEVKLELQSFNVSEEDIQAGDPVIAKWEPPEYIEFDESYRSA